MGEEYIFNKLQDIANESIINDVLTNFKEITSNTVHRHIQAKIEQWGIDNGFKCMLEYKVSRRCDFDYNQGFIDIYLLVKEISFLIEIDSSPRYKSLYKLRNNSSDFKVWLYCNTDEFKEYIKSEKLKDIILIPIYPYKLLLKEIKKTN